MRLVRLATNTVYDSTCSFKASNRILKTLNNFIFFWLGTAWVPKWADRPSVSKLSKKVSESWNQIKITNWLKPRGPKQLIEQTNCEWRIGKAGRGHSALESSQNVLGQNVVRPSQTTMQRNKTRRNEPDARHQTLKNLRKVLAIFTFSEFCAASVPKVPGRAPFSQHKHLPAACTRSNCNQIKQQAE